jgi:folate-binding protein YgfZ
MMDQIGSDRESAGAGRPPQGSFIDVTGRAAILLIGQDGQDLLQRLSTNDLSPLKEGGHVQTILTNEKGRIIDVLSVMKLEARKLLLVGQAAGAQNLLQWLNKFIIMEDARTELASSLYAHVLIFDIDALAGGLKMGIDLDGMWSYFEDWGGTKLQHILADVARGNEVIERLSRAGFSAAQHRDFDEFRIKNGIPGSPSELSDNYNPLEANLAHLVSWTKGCYIGQEVIARLDTYKKVQRRLMRMALKEMPKTTPCPLFSGKDEGGTLTSAVWARGGTTILGLGYVRTQLLEAGGGLSFRKNGDEVAKIPAEERDRIIAGGK